MLFYELWCKSIRLTKIVLFRIQFEKFHFRVPLFHKRIDIRKVCGRAHVFVFVQQIRNRPSLTQRQRQTLLPLYHRSEEQKVENLNSKPQNIFCMMASINLSAVWFRFDCLEYFFSLHFLCSWWTKIDSHFTWNTTVCVWIWKWIMSGPVNSNPNDSNNIL